MNTLLSLMAATIFVAFISAFLNKLIGKKTGWLLAILPAAMTLTLLGHLGEVGSIGPVGSFVGWMPDIGFNIAFHLDGLSILMGLMICGIGTFILIYGGGYLKGDQYLGRFYVAIQLFLVAMLGVVVSDNLILLFIFWELTSMTSFLLIGYSHDKAESRTAALHALLVTAGGGLCLLVGFVLLGMSAGTFEISRMVQTGYTLSNSPMETAAFILIFLGAFTKSAQFPFHFWLPGAMAAPTPVSSYLHSATMVKAGVFLLARLQPVMSTHQWWMGVLVFFGTITMLWGAFLAVKKLDLKQILAYTTLSALGLMMVLLAFPIPYATVAFVCFILSHALYKGTLFMVAGIVDHQTGTRDVSKLSGLSKSLPLTGFAVLLASVAMAGFMPTLSFIGKELILEAFLKDEVIGIVLALTTAMAAVAFTYVAALFLWTFFANRPSEKQYKEGYPSLLIGPIVLSILGFVLGVAFPVTEVLVHTAAVAMVGGSVELPSLALWHGVNLPLALSIISIVVGVGTFILLGKGPFTYGEGALAKWALAVHFDRFYQSVLKNALKIAGIMQHGKLRYYMRTTVIGTCVLVALSFMINGYTTYAPDFETLYLHEILVFLIIISASLMATVVKSRLATIACLGIIGFMIAIIYVMYSAPDLAMTQILVETLTVVLFALVIYKLPAYKTLSSKLTVFMDVIISAVFGMLFTLYVLGASATRWADAISQTHGEISWIEAYGRNVVNVILVDFRALDTMGELAVVGIAAIGFFALLKYRKNKKEQLL